MRIKTRVPWGSTSPKDFIIQFGVVNSRPGASGKKIRGPGPGRAVAGPRARPGGRAGGEFIIFHRNLGEKIPLPGARSAPGAPPKAAPGGFSARFR